jgi:hypothetical protein
MDVTDRRAGTEAIGARTLGRSASTIGLWWSLLIPIAGAIVAAVVVTGLWAPRLPGEVANQWSEGSVRTVRTLPATIASLALPATAFWIVLAGYVAGGRSATAWVRRTTVGALTAVVVTLVLALPIVVAPSLTVADPWLAPDPGAVALSAAAVAGIVVGTLAGILVGPAPVDHEQAEVPRGTTTKALEQTFVAPLSVAVAITGGVLVALGALGVVWWGVALLGGACTAVAAVGLRWRVVLTDQDFALRPLLGPGAFAVRRELGASAHVEASRSWGPLGWGIQFGRGRSAQILLGGGDVLVLRRPDGTELRATVPNAVELAAEFDRGRS